MSYEKEYLSFSSLKIRHFRYTFFQKILLLKIKRAKVFLVTFTVLLLCTFNMQVPAWAADGDFDSSFGTGGKVTTDIGTATADEALSVVMQSDGKIVVAGSAVGANSDVAVVRYNANGTEDLTFGTDGKKTTDIGTATDDYAFSVVMQSDGKIVVAGYFINVRNNFAVARYNADGTEDLTFGTDGKQTMAISSWDNEAYSVVLQSDGKIVVAGIAGNALGIRDFAVVRYTYEAPPSGGGSGSSTSTPSLSTSSLAVKSVEASFKLTNRKYLSKFEIRKAITKDRSFKSKTTDKYKYSISKASKKNCVMRGNYFMRLKKSGVCEITVTRTTNKGVKSNYQVTINYNN